MRRSCTWKADELVTVGALVCGWSWLWWVGWMLGWRCMWDKTGGYGSLSMQPVGCTALCSTGDYVDCVLRKAVATV